MNITQHVSLSDHSTMRLGGTAAYFAELRDTADIPNMVTWARENKLPIKVIGDGSNIVWKDSGYQGLLVKNLLQGISIEGDDEATALLTIATGENWDNVVSQTVAMDLYGIECLSLIPGTVGGTPVQNVGAYGQDISQVLVHLTAYDVHAQKFVTIPKEDCNFGYRTSRFKHKDDDQFIITSITIKLTKEPDNTTLYPAVEAWLKANQITDPTPRDLRSAVIAIRSSKLPDPKIVANNGSFFANPIISNEQFAKLHATYPTIAAWELADTKDHKVSAAWLIETAGYKNHHDPATGMGTWPKQPLVLINESATSSAQLITYRDAIVTRVKEMFGITLVQEPELLP